MLDCRCASPDGSGLFSARWWASPSGLRRQVVALEIEGSNPSVHPTPIDTLSEAKGLDHSPYAAGADQRASGGRPFDKLRAGSEGRPYSAGRGGS